MIDLLISGGTILDGSGKPGFKADVAVTDSLISDIGDLSEAQAQETIDATDKHVCPGFIDVHSHSDTYILLAPSAESKITQGITTEVVGNCGASAAPLVGNARLPSDWAAMEYPGQWRTVAEYRSLLEKTGPALNIMLLVGHNTLHGGVIGYERTDITPGHLSEMTSVLEQAMDEGASGLSTGLLYAPGLFATEDEVVALCKTVAKKNGIYTTHMRNESSRVTEALDEALRIAEKSGVRLQVSHLKASGRNNWHLLDQVLDRIHLAQAQGMEVAADRYPYLAGCTDLDVVLPDWAQEGTRTEILDRLTQPESRAKILTDLRASRSESDWNNVTVGSVTAETLIQFKGTPLLEVAEAMKTDPCEAIIRLITEDQLRTSAFFAGMSEENMIRILSEPYVMLGSDASLRTTKGILSNDYPHPRAFGSFPSYIRMAIDHGFIDLPEAIRKVTSLPAGQFQMKNRGLLKKAYAADIVVFDASSIRAAATYSNPHAMSQGVDDVIVNGTPAVMQGRITEKHGGVFLTTS